MSLVYGETQDSFRNRKLFLNNFNIAPLDLICAQQVHSDNVKYVDHNHRGMGASDYKTAIAAADALITDKRNLALGVFTADCLSIFLYDEKQKAIGIIHAGWRGSKAGIVGNTIEAMADRFDTRPVDLRVVLGPLIRSCCYEVGDEFKDFFPSTIRNKNNRLYLDLASENKNQLLNKRVRSENIYDSLICCSCRNDDFFSYRREGSGCSLRSVLSRRVLRLLS